MIVFVALGLALIVLAGAYTTLAGVALIFRAGWTLDTLAGLALLLAGVYAASVAWARLR